MELECFSSISHLKPITIMISVIGLIRVILEGVPLFLNTVYIKY